MCSSMTPVNSGLLISTRSGDLKLPLVNWSEVWYGVNMGLTRADKRERIAHAKRLVQSANLSDRLRKVALGILDNGPNQRQVSVIIEMAIRHGGIDE